MGSGIPSDEVGSARRAAIQGRLPISMHRRYSPRVLVITRSTTLVLALIAALAALLAPPVPAGPDKAKIVSPLAEPTDHHILLSFELAGAFDDEVRRRIDSGLPTGFRFRLRLTRDRKRWFDTDLASSDLRVVANYNAVTREYLINYMQDGLLVQSRVVRDAAELEHAMTHFERFPVFALSAIPPGSEDRRVRVRIRAELGAKTFLLLIPTAITTDWAESPRFRPVPSDS